MKNGLIIDCFAGGGGASVGIEMALGRQVDIAVNHDPDAILMHKTNHPDTLHLTEDIFKVNLQKYVNGRHVALMWASPDCTSHSKAKGSQPREKGLRILPWAVYKHAKAIMPDVVIMENVEEIQKWGPLDEGGHTIRSREGEDYNKFINAMKSLGYQFDSRELVAADYGAPTTRKRWYAIFRKDGRPIMWPVPTHSKGAAGGLMPWEECGKYIDWSDLGKSIFGRKKPLAEATMKRIANGMVKYVVNNPDPYMVKNDEAYAFLIQYHGEQKEGDARGQSLREPVKTIDTSNRYGLVVAFVTKYYKTGIGQGCEEPIHTITTSPGHFGLISTGEGAETTTDGQNGAEPEKSTQETEKGKNGANTEQQEGNEEHPAAGDDYQTPHPEGITSLCYSCTEYETCNVKTGTCTKCDQYKNRSEAYKTEEQRYSEEQDRIDRETTRKLREKADEERMNNIPSASGESGQKVHQIRLGESFFEDACSNIKSFELRKNDRNYKKGDILELMEFADGRNTGRMVRKLVTYILEDYTGLEDGFCIMATVLVNKDGEALQGADLRQICADIRANGDGYIDGGEEYILIDKAVGIVEGGGLE